MIWFWGWKIKGQGHRISGCIFHTIVRSMTQKTNDPKILKLYIGNDPRISYKWNGFGVSRSRVGVMVRYINTEWVRTLWVTSSYNYIIIIIIIIFCIGLAYCTYAWNQYELDEWVTAFNFVTRQGVSYVCRIVVYSRIAYRAQRGVFVWTLWDVQTRSIYRRAVL